MFVENNKNGRLLKMILELDARMGEHIEWIQKQRNKYYLA